MPDVEMVKSPMGGEGPEAVALYCAALFCGKTGGQYRSGAEVLLLADQFYDWLERRRLMAPHR